MSAVADGDVYWIERVRRGDRTALEVLFRRHSGRVFGFAYALLRNREDAEEIVTETFLHALRSAGGLRGDARFESWLLRIARNQCLDRLRRPRLLTLPLEEAPSAQVLLTPVDEMGQMALRTLVEAAMDRLPEEHRVALILRDIQGFSAREAAEVMGKGETAFRSLHQRARRMLRDALAELDREPETGDEE